MERDPLDSNCAVCRKPISHPICIDCLESRIRKWLRKEAPFLIPELERIHSWLKNNFQDGSEGPTTCTVCNSQTQFVLCSYCYVREVYHHLRRFSQSVADRLTLTFDFDFQGTGYHSELEANPNSLQRIPSKDSGIGICDQCENYSNSLIQLNGRTVCESCREHESVSRRV